MSSDPINTIAIQQFIQQVKIADASQQKEIRMDIKNAKALSFALTEVLAKLTQDYEILLKELLKAKKIVALRDFKGLFAPLILFKEIALFCWSHPQKITFLSVHDE